MDKSIRSFREKIQKEITPKRFVIRTYGACQSNRKEMILETDCDYAMWAHGVAKITIGDETAYFDVDELINYLRVGR